MNQETAAVLKDAFTEANKQPGPIKWGPDDVPPLCWIRNGQCDNAPSLICGLDDGGARIFWHDANVEHKSRPHYVTYERMFEAWEHSTDLKTWRPCAKHPTT